MSVITNIIYDSRHIWETYYSDSEKKCQNIWLAGYKDIMYLGCDYAQKRRCDISNIDRFLEQPPYVCRFFDFSNGFSELNGIENTEKFRILIQVEYDVNFDDSEKLKTIQNIMTTIQLIRH